MALFNVAFDGNVASKPKFKKDGDMNILELFMLQDHSVQDESEESGWRVKGTTKINVVYYGDNAEHLFDLIEVGTPLTVIGEERPNNYKPDGSDTEVFGRNIVAKKLAVTLSKRVETVTLKKREQAGEAKAA